MNIVNAISKVSILNIVIALALFLISFLLKFQRLAIIITALDTNSGVESMQKLLIAHLKSAILSLIMPFKLGDVARVYFLRGCNQTYMSSIGIVAFERILDLTVVFFLILIVGSTFSFLAILDGLLATTRLGIIIAFILFCYVALSTIVFWHSIFLKRNFMRFRSLMIMAERLIFSVRVAKEVLINKGLSLIIFTVIIWLIEASAFVLIYSYISDNSSLILFLALISFIAFALPAGPVGYGSIQLVFYFAFSSGLIATDLSQDGFIYSLFVYVPALLILGLLTYALTKRRGHGEAHYL